jgi:alanyl-tRNA synthetase
MTTARLYYDSDALAFTATAIAHEGGDATRVILDRTAFYPTSGGQPHDIGTLGGVRVVDVLDHDDVIVHVCDAPVAFGAVEGVMDAARRRDYTQQHTAQHLLSALAGDRMGWYTDSVHFGERHSTIEFAVPAASDAQLADLATWATAAIAAAHPVTIGYEDAATATGLRKPSDRAGIIRIVTIAGLDRSACGGTHVRTTAEVGPVLLIGTEKVRGHLRVSYVAGDRALARVEWLEATVREAAEAMSCSTDELAALVPKRVAEVVAARDRIAELETALAGYRVAELAASVPVRGDGIRVVRVTGEGPGVLKGMAHAIATMERTLFIGTGGLPPTIVVATSADSGLDAGALLKPALAARSGRGGGSVRIAQGTAPDVEQVAEAVIASSS